MADEDANGSLSISAPQQAEMHLPSHSEPVDVVWLSGSAIAVAPRTNPPQEHQQEPNPAGAENSESDHYYEVTNDSDAESDSTVEYQSSQVEVITVSESDVLDTESESRESEPEEESEQVVTGLLENPAIFIQHVNPAGQLVQEPNVVTVPENPAAGVENPIIRLENPDYEPETSKSSSSEGTRTSNKRSYGMMLSKEEDDGHTCPVCFDIWTDSGEHRLSALKCGHLFGKSCILRWLSKEKKKYCPQCNKKAHPNHVRELYATKLIAWDSSEKDRLQKELQALKDKKKKLEIENMRCNLNIEKYKKQLETFKKMGFNLTGDLDFTLKCQTKTESKLVNRVIKFYLEKTLEISEGCCRVCAYDALTNVLVVSHQTRNQLFPGYGIKKIQKVGSDYLGNNFIYLHSKALRDLSFHPITHHLMLTVSFDKFAKITDLKENSVKQTFKADYPIWSCCWDADDPNFFYVGAGNGCVHVFDVRRPTECSATLGPADDSTAVASLRYAPCKPPFKGGIICCRLNTITVYEKTGPAEYTPTPLHGLVGPFFSLCYDSTTQHILVSCRPSEAFPKVRHIYCELTGTDCRQVHTFCGGTRQTLLSRSCFIRICNETLVAVFQENSKSIELWSTSTGTKIQSIPVNDSVVDFTAIQVENRYLLGAVSNAHVRFYETANCKC